MAAQGVEEPSESLKHKTWFLKVPIKCSCEGCKKKVRRILYKVEGVYTVDVDTKQQKVTVIGDVNADVLIKKLAKHGKDAKLWPQNSEPTEKKSGKVKNKDKQENPETDKPAAVNGGATGGDGGDKEIKPPVKVEAVETVKESGKKGVEVSGGGGGDAKATAAAGETTGGVETVGEKKSEEKKPVTGSAGNKSVEKSGVDIKSVESGSVVEKKKSKGQKGKSTEGGEPSSGPTPARIVSPTHEYGPPPPANQSPPRHQGYQHDQLPHYNVPPPVMSYNMAHPSSSYTASYYPQPRPYSYAYSHTDPVVHTLPPEYNSYPPHQQLDSFEIISDENPNGCLIM